MCFFCSAGLIVKRIYYQKLVRRVAREMSRGREVEMPIYRFFSKIWVCILEYGKTNTAANKNCQEYVFEA